ncbi:LRR domain containing protein [Parasponia andersonii]|uniref:LRR domain containing protein n=1 Tax=Parasponia andersonii TaxID=3476 RepID=A0A2P5A9L0_PARAD|nr:LRR domain containing protein [Parasponia andersonii]
MATKNLLVTTLELSNTGFFIDLPNLLRNSRSFSILLLSGCTIVGSLPQLLCNLTQLHSLDLSHNNLRGHIPWSIFSLQQLSFLDLSYNNFLGQLPKIHSNSTNNFSLYDSSVYAMGSTRSSLTTLSLSHNLLSGKIPS